MNATILLLVCFMFLASCGGGGGGGKNNSSSVAIKLDQTPLAFSSATQTSQLAQEVIYSLSGGSGSGVIVYSSSNTNVATIDSSGKITILGAGSTLISAKKSGDTTFKDASASFTLTVTKKAQEALQFPQLTLEIRLGDSPVSQVATGGSTANPVSYQIQNPLLATVDPITGIVTPLQSGETQIVATKAGDDLYETAETQYKLVIKKQLQSPLAFQNASLEKYLDADSFTNSLSGGSGTGELSFTSSNPSIVEVDKDQGTIKVLNYGETIITAIKKADLQFEEASASFILHVVKKPQKPLEFEKQAIEVYLGDNIYQNTVSGGSGNGLVTYSSSDEKIAQVDKYTGEIKPVMEGKVVIRATKAEDPNYLASYADYSLSSILIVDKVIADIGLNETLVSWEKQSGAVSYFRTSNIPCDHNNVNACVNGKELYVASTTTLPLKDDLLNASTPGFIAVGNNTHIASFQRIEKKSPEFSYRFDASFIAFKNKLFVIGGIQYADDDTCNNEIWTSKDGLSWTQAKKNAAFSARSRHQIIEFNNALWLYGGEVCMDQGSYFSNELWRSEDGTNWTQVPINTPMSSRSNHSFIVFNGKMWIFGGAFGNTEIWSSSEGSYWEKAVTDAPFKARTGQQIVVFKNKLWLIGGLTFGPEDFVIKNDIWSSDDGINWVKEKENANFSPRQKHQVIAFNNELYLIGGNGNDFGSKNESWRSTNGADWELVNSPIINAALSSSQVTLFNNYLWLLENNVKHSVWRSKDGINWYTPQRVRLEWSPR